jgi:hypothetical protein
VATRHASPKLPRHPPRCSLLQVSQAQRLHGADGQNSEPPRFGFRVWALRADASLRGSPPHPPPPRRGWEGGRVEGMSNMTGSLRMTFRSKRIVLIDPIESRPQPKRHMMGWLVFWLEFGIVFSWPVWGGWGAGAHHLGSGGATPKTGRGELGVSSSSQDAEIQQHACVYMNGHKPVRSRCDVCRFDRATLWMYGAAQIVLDKAWHRGPWFDDGKGSCVERSRSKQI